MDSSWAFLFLCVGGFVMKTRGRPKKYDGKNYIFSMRLNEEYGKMLEYAARIQGKSKVDVIRNGIRMSYNLAKSNEDID